MLVRCGKVPVRVEGAEMAGDNAAICLDGGRGSERQKGQLTMNLEGTKTRGGRRRGKRKNRTRLGQDVARDALRRKESTSWASQRHPYEYPPRT